MPSVKSLSIVIVIVIINLFVLTNCAVDDDDGKLIFAHVVSFQGFRQNHSWKLNLIFISFSLCKKRYLDMEIERLSNHTPQILGRIRNGGP